MLNFGNKEFRNLQEQVEKNKEDILKVEQSLGSALPDPIPGPIGDIGPQGPQGEQGEKGPGMYGTTENLPSPSSYKYGDMYLLNDGRIFKNIQNRWVPQTNLRGPQGVAGPEGTPVVANPDGEATDDLNTIKINGVIYTLTFDESTLDGKLDKDTSSSTYTEAYCKLPNGSQYMYPISNAETGNTIPTRTNGGQIKVADPVLGVDAVNKSYLVSNYDTKGNIEGKLSLKQNTLVSGTNIKTINGQSLLGSGNLAITASSVAWGNITGNISLQTDLNNALTYKESIVNKTSNLSADSTVLYPSVKGVRDFVNSSIQSVAANYVTTEEGTIFETKADLLAGPWYHEGVEYTPTKNDYAVVFEDESADDDQYRYSFDGTNWVQQYRIGSTFTAAQQAALDSGITAQKILDLQSGLTMRGTLINCSPSVNVNTLENGSYFVSVAGTLVNSSGATADVNVGDFFTKGRFGISLMSSTGLCYLGLDDATWDEAYAPTFTELKDELDGYAPKNLYATPSRMGLVMMSSRQATACDSTGILYSSVKSYSDFYDNTKTADTALMSRKTFDNCLTGKGLVPVSGDSSDGVTWSTITINGIQRGVGGGGGGKKLYEHKWYWVDNGAPEYIYYYSTDNSAHSVNLQFLRSLMQGSNTNSKAFGFRYWSPSKAFAISPLFWNTGMDRCFYVMRSSASSVTLGDIMGMTAGATDTVTEL